MKTCVIVNPNAGSAEDLEHLRQALRRLEGAELRESARSGHVQELARKAVDEGFDRVVAAGGDGTISETINGMAPDFGRVAFGVIPLGTGNDFARSIDVPHDAETAIDVLAADQTHLVDVVRVRNGGTCYWVNTSGAGFAPLIHEQIDRSTKNWWGGWAYFWAGLKTLPEVPEYQTTLVLDGLERMELKTYNIVICNGRYVGGGIAVAPQALIDDGMVELVIVPVLALPKLPELFTRLLQGQPQEMEDLVVRRARQIRIEASPPMLFNADGEQAGQSPMEYEVLTRSLRVVTGPNPCVQASQRQGPPQQQVP